MCRGLEYVFCFVICMAWLHSTALYTFYTIVLIDDLYSGQLCNLTYILLSDIWVGSVFTIEDNTCGTYSHKRVIERVLSCILMTNVWKWLPGQRAEAVVCPLEADGKVHMR